MRVRSQLCRTARKKTKATLPNAETVNNHNYNGVIYIMHAEHVRSCMDANSAADSRRRILVLEEDEHLASLLYLLLCRKGFSISAFADLHSAQAYIGSNTPAGMIFVSHRWLRVEQPQILEFIARHSAWTSTPIIMLMNYYDLDLVERATMLGITDHLLQPFEPDQLVDIIVRYLDKPTPRTFSSIGKRPAG